MSDPGTEPVEAGEQYTVEIEEIGDEGDGIAHIESFVLLVPDAELGARVTVRVESVQDGFATTTVLADETMDDEDTTPGDEDTAMGTEE